MSQKQKIFFRRYTNLANAPKWIQTNNEIMMQKEGKYQFDKDKEAVKSYFIDFVNKNTVFFHDLKEKLDYLIENKYYEKSVFDKYSFGDIKRIFKQVYDKKFRFPSFMSAYKFYNNYALKTEDNQKFLERYEDRIATVALTLADGNYEYASLYAEEMIERRYQPATPTFLSAGKKRRGEFVSCFLLMTDDTMNSISHNINNALQLSKRGGGVSHNLTDLRGHGDPIKGIEGRASGVVPVMKLLEDSYSYSNQLGVRDGAGAAYLNIFHIDVVDFLSTKKINADEKSRIKTLSLGLIVPDKFFELVEKDYDMYLFSPYGIEKEYGKRMSEINISEIYDLLVENPRIRKKKISARDMLTMIAQTQIESGYPYLFFEDNVNKVHPLANEGKVKFSNICTEIIQLSETSVINDYNQEDEINRDISCNLGSLNIVNVMESKNIKDSVRAGVRMLDMVTKMTNIETVPSVAKGNREMASIGLGAMNLHGYLAKNNIQYESKEALEFVDAFFSTVRFYTLFESMMIAKEESRVFRGFEGSKYQTGEYFDQYLKHDYSPKSPKVITLFEGINLPSTEDWRELKEWVGIYGLANAYQNAIAPTGSISYVQSSTASISPITEKIEHRTYGDSDTYYPMPYMNESNFFYYKEAYNMDMYKMIDLYAVVQKHIDQGISCTLYLKDTMTTREISKLYMYAWMKGLKTLYYSRVERTDNTSDFCVSCVV
ncbi:class 1b ribonucleoside-diphosphate reductase subunit alpha [Paenibacillus sp. CMAA1739]|uniref:class 1b ribonucleoside-diphosphate reductase subunit alpha n=1 Tax=Paenibacillus ottowii TaxID=2315729 RepID=UPI002DBECABD|nr:class 1b ribonucleoside-diphosphate reductase subunit alpha [Paenibacillus sp. CMAA1739]MEC4565527.1 class 1b ribonucleoside-diphosphate reductase subunit alpha [Paenibacillus sp. CMAA1739]